jgi:hypothetical protein
MFGIRIVFSALIGVLVAGGAQARQTGSNDLVVFQDQSSLTCFRNRMTVEAARTEVAIRPVTVRCDGARMLGSVRQPNAPPVPYTPPLRLNLTSTQASCLSRAEARSTPLTISLRECGVTRPGARAR